jgi:cytochrome oxidase Cu insertion factor (SCO1/SenC/PrrC family)
MIRQTVSQRFAAMEEQMSAEEYNFSHFGWREIALDAKITISGQGIQPGTIAPDFELPRVDGGKVRLSDLRDKPVLLHFGSFT